MNETKSNIILATDGYKLDHRRQYPEKTEIIYSNLTARSNKYYPEAYKGYVFAGLQYFIIKNLIEKFNEEFFRKDNSNKHHIFNLYKNRINKFLGNDNKVGVEHIKELYKLGYIPLEIRALPEGTLVPIGVPCMTIKNTHNDFFWLTNYLETLFSCELWMTITSATTARLFKERLLRHAIKTGWDNTQLDSLGFLCHDFSMRGMPGVEASVLSGLGHLFSFYGSETIPAIDEMENYYCFNDYLAGGKIDNSLIAATVPATEHSVMCAGGYENEIKTYKRLLTKTYPEGFVSIVSDTWDYWKVITEYLPQLKNVIMNRNGRFVVRPDSGDPVNIICGNNDCNKAYPEKAKMSYSDYCKSMYIHYDKLKEVEWKGTYELLWDMFGGYINDAGYKVLDSHIGIIYGDSITLERQNQIYERLEAKGFAATNLVLGVGSYTYQGKTRDSLGMAIKTTWCQIDGNPVPVWKDPTTDDKTKKSLRGLLQVHRNKDGELFVIENCQTDNGGLLEPVFKNGLLLRTQNLSDIRKRIDSSIKINVINKQVYD